MGMTIVLLDADTLGSDVDLGGLERFGRLVCHATTAPHETAERIAGADVVITNKVVIDRPLMDATPSLRLVCVAATGMNNIDCAYAGEKGIAVKNVAGYSTESVVQVTFSHVLYLLHQHAYYDTYAKTQWRESPLFTHLGSSFYELAGKQWGIIGLGAIGRRVAQVAEAFGCRVVYYSTTGQNRSDRYQRVDLDGLLASSRIISVHAPLTPQTANLIDYTGLSRICDGGIIVNAGRGGIVNEADLARMLDERPLYAGTDVTSREPIEPDNPLLSIRHQERLSMTPHIAWASVEARQRLVDGIALNIKTFIEE